MENRKSHEQICRCIIGLLVHEIEIDYIETELTWKTYLQIQIKWPQSKLPQVSAPFLMICLVKCFVVVYSTQEPLQNKQIKSWNTSIVNF